MAIAREQLDRVGRHQWIRESLNQRGLLNDQVFIFSAIHSPFLTFDWFSVQSRVGGGVRWRFWKIMIDWPSVRVEKLICIGRASLARCSAAKKNGHILRIRFFVFFCYVLYSTSLHGKKYNLFIIRRHVYSYVDRDTGTYILYSTLQYDDEHRIYLFFSFLILFFSFRFNQKENLISLSLSLQPSDSYVHTYIY